VRFAMLASGGRIRLFDAGAPAGSTSRYLDLDNAYLQDKDRPLLAVLGPQYLHEGGFEVLRAEAEAFGAALRRRLDETIRDSVFPALGHALAGWAEKQGLDLSSEDTLAELERATLTLLFRLLFLLYAESSNYLPRDNRSYSHASLSSLVSEAVETRDRLGLRSTSLWDRYVLLVRAMRTGNPAWGVPAYNGALFAPDGFDGADTLEQMSLPDPDFATVLIGLGRDRESNAGIDYSSLEIGHLGHIYEALLSLRLVRTATPLRYNRQTDAFQAVEPGEEAEYRPGDLVWMTNEGGRKGGGVYYTPAPLVRHLVRETVVPTFKRHLSDVRSVVEGNPELAAQRLFDFAVIDPACGSAHFLVEVLNELADMTVTFLGATPLPAIADAVGRLRAASSPGIPIDDVTLIRRLVLKRCVFGVDASQMRTEVAKVSLWLASFVPGLSLAYLGANVRIGNSLIGVARSAYVVSPGAPLLTHPLTGAIDSAATAAARVAAIDDRTPDEVAASEEAAAEARTASAALERLFNLWTAEGFGVGGARHEVELHGTDLLAGRESKLQSQADAAARDHTASYTGQSHFLSCLRVKRPVSTSWWATRPGTKFTVETLAFYALFSPGLRGLPEPARTEAIARLLSSRPELTERLEAAKEAAERERHYFSAGDYPSMPGDPDL